jgi:uncharacterized protein
MQGMNAVSSLTTTQICVGGQTYTSSLIVPWCGPILTWPAPEFKALSTHHLDVLLALQPELIIIGTGAQGLLLPAPLRAHIMSQKIGLESMNNGAACRTYNVLISEHRRVVLALIL